MTRDEYGAAIAVGLVRAREAAGLSVAQVAVEAGVAESTIRHGEATGAVRMRAFERLCDVYEVTFTSVLAPR